MRFLLINQFYPPDVAPTGQLLHDVARTLVERGHQVRVVCSRASYAGRETGPPPAAREVMDGVEVRRLRGARWGRASTAGRLAGYGAFLAGAAARALLARPRPHLVLCLTTPPFLGLAARLASSLRGTAHAHWLMDVYPDAAVAHGMVRERGPSARLLRALARHHLRGAALVLTLSPRMAGRSGRYVSGRSRHEWVTPWTHDEPAAGADAERARLRQDRGWTDEETVLLYAGNMGLGHRVSEFLEAARRLGPAGPRWAFVGGGPRRQEVAAFRAGCPQARVELLDYVPRADLGASLAAGDVHLASLSSAWQDLMVPSKVVAAFSAARPVIFVGARTSDAAAWIEESGGGWVVRERDVEGLLAAVAE
ncbi:MAG TPA: glycosyltransferase family 4 protein, partial [Vicinamibacteria bacterium]|nr:glycosyltransferase family 4 protein [Vicinamibacteria bacterium]